MLQAETYWELIARRAEDTPDAPMLLDESGCRLTFSEYKSETEKLAAVLHDYGVREGKWVTWQLPTGIRAALLMGALTRLGAVQNPLIHLYREREIKAILEKNRTDFFVGDDENCVPSNMPVLSFLDGLTHGSPKVINLNNVEQAIRGANVARLPKFIRNPESVRWVFYTSGTTAAPKGAQHADYSILSAGFHLAAAYELNRTDIGCLAFPIAHIGGPMYLAEILASGAAVLLLPTFKAASAADVLGRFRVTACGGSTVHYQTLLEEKRSQGVSAFLPDLRVMGGGGAPKPPTIFYQCKSEIGFTISHSYGMTECPCVTVSPVTSTDEQLACTDGMPQPDVEVKIVSSEGLIAPTGTEGEIRIRGRAIFKGYTDDELNQAAFDENNFFRTGDVGSLRQDGRLVISGRLKEIIIRKGENISAKEVEDVLVRHPKVAAVAVIGLPDSISGERVCAVIELKEQQSSLEFSEMVEFLKSFGLMRQKIPEQLEIVDALPRNQTFQKVLKQELRNWFTEE